MFHFLVTFSSYIYLLGFEWSFWKGFNCKYGPTVQGIYWGFASRKIKIPAFPLPCRSSGYK